MNNEPTIEEKLQEELAELDRLERKFSQELYTAQQKIERVEFLRKQAIEKAQEAIKKRDSPRHISFFMSDLAYMRKIAENL